MASKFLITKNVLILYDEYVIQTRSSSPVADVLPFREWVYSKLETVKKKEEVKQSTHPKLKFLEFIYLTQEEYGNLISGYGLEKVKELIARMNDYIGSKWDKYKSHYFTALSRFTQKWVKRIDIQKELPPKPEVKVEKEYVPMTPEQREEAKAKLLSFRNKYGST